MPPTDLTPQAYAFTIRLSQLRSLTRIGAALSDAFPDEDAWGAALQDPEIVESLNAVAEILDDVLSDGDTDAGEALVKHYARALEALEPLAERFQCDPEDLLVVLTNL